MACPNCGSPNIVTIQKQNYCINCGQLVDISAPSQKKVNPPGAHSTPAAAPRPPGSMSDLKPRARPLKPPRPTRPQATSPPATPPGFTVHSAPASPAPPALAPAGDRTLTGIGLLRRLPRNGWRYNVAAGGLTTVVLGAIIWSINQSYTTTAQPGWWAGLVAITFLAMALRARATAATTYGLAKLGDGRPVRITQWGRAGWQSLLSILVLAWLMLLVAGITVLLAVAANVALLQLPLPTGAIVAIGIVLDIGLAIIGLSLLAIWSLERVAVVVGGLSTAAAERLVFGWWQHHGQRWLWRTTSLTVVVLSGYVLVAALVASLVWAAHSTGSILLTVLSGGLAGGLISLAITLQLGLTQAYWLHYYRREVHQFHYAHSAQLQAGRNLKPSNGRRYWLGLILAMGLLALVIYGLLSPSWLAFG